MAKFKTRLQYNSMGERVVVRVAVDDIDAFAARSRQGSHLVQDQQKQQHRQCFDGGAGGWGPQAVQPDGMGNSTVTDNNTEDTNDTSCSNGLGDGDRKAFGGEGRVSIDEECEECALDGRQASPPSLPSKNVSKSLGFGWPDFSSVDSKACVLLSSVGSILPLLGQRNASFFFYAQALGFIRLTMNAFHPHAPRRVGVFNIAWVVPLAARCLAVCGSEDKVMSRSCPTLILTLR